MLELRPPKELAPRLEIPEDARILSLNGPNPVEGLHDADYRSDMELPQLEEESYDVVFAWFTDPDEKRAASAAGSVSRVMTPGGSVWLIVPKKNSLNHGKAQGVPRGKVLPDAESDNMEVKKTLGIGPHYFAIRLMKHP